MNIKIYRKNKNIPLPERKTIRSVGLDIYASETIELIAGQPVLIPTGLIIESPPGYFFKIFIRSGLSIKYGISLINDVGIVDEDYCGPDDEVKIGLIRHFNPNNPDNGKPFIIEEGTRIAQIIFEKNEFTEIEWEEKDDPNFAGKTRGGFGSTGSK